MAFKVNTRDSCNKAVPRGLRQRKPDRAFPIRHVIRCLAHRDRSQPQDLSSSVTDSVLVPWLAFQNQSQLAAEALVEAAVALYRLGWTVEEVQLEMTFLTLQSQQEEIKQVQELDSEMLLSFICLIMITCKETDCPLFKIEECESPSIKPSNKIKEATQPSQESTRLSGLQQYARQTLQQYTNGATLRGMMKKQKKAVSAIQSTAGSPGSPGSAPQSMSPNMLYMQNLTRIILLTVESLQQRGLVPPRLVLIQNLRSKFGMAEVPPQPGKSAPSARSEPTHFARHLHPVHAHELRREALLESHPLQRMQVRWLAVRMLLAFMGAAMGWAYSWRVFVSTALLAYLAGVSAQDLMNEVSQQEFSQAGTMFKAAASATIQSEKINAEAFARWLSTAYMTWALMGIEHPADEEDSGWAWVPIQLDTTQDNSVVAHAMAEFVARNLRQIQQEEQDGVIPEDNRTLGNAAIKSDTGVDRQWLEQRLVELRSDAVQDRLSKGFLTAKIEDPELARSSTSLTYMLQQSAVVKMCRDAVMAPAV